MKFGPVATRDALGAVLAHSQSAGSLRLKKGVRLKAEDLEALAAAGIGEIIVAQLEEGDVGEDDAAAQLAAALNAEGVRVGAASTGRVNLFAEHNGLFRVNAALVDAFNRIDQAITLATLPDHEQVSAGDMVATIKIIPLAVAATNLEKAIKAISTGDVIALLPFASVKVGLIATELPSLKVSVMDKTRRLLAERLSASGSVIVEEMRVPHTGQAVGEAMQRFGDDCDLVIVFGASAIVDSQDVIPAGIVEAGGVVDHVGMPVDPGNLLVLGHVGETPVIGAPGCARSPKENGFDWVLARILAGETPTGDTIMGMGVGGLLKEIPSRPQPRLKAEAASNKDLSVDIVVLAAGRASRMGTAEEGTPPHKLLAEFDGTPLIRRSCKIALDSDGNNVHVVTGYRSAEMNAAIADLDVDVIDNPDFDDGMASSLRCGIGALGTDVPGALIMLADMPAIEAADLSKMIAAFRKAGGRTIIRAASGDVRGNPVILPRQTFDAITRLEGDVGARQIIANAGLPIVDVDIGDAALLDVDTRQAVIDAGGVLKT
ncbi:MAG: molybdopterin-binding/glycosyltransferase family 2 protein [Pseudomonadota bacterium]